MRTKMTIAIVIIANVLLALIMAFFDMATGSRLAIYAVAFVVNILSLWFFANIVVQRGLDARITLLLAVLGNLPGLLLAYWMQIRTGRTTGNLG